jgi:hypothetical protein
MWLIVRSHLCVQGVLGKLPELTQLLDAERTEGPDLTAPRATPYGTLSPPLGQARLKAVEVLYSILGLSDPAAEQGVAPATLMLAGSCFVSELCNFHDIKPLFWCCCAELLNHTR